MDVTIFRGPGGFSRRGATVDEGDDDAAAEVEAASLSGDKIRSGVLGFMFEVKLRVEVYGISSLRI